MTDVVAGLDLAFRDLLVEAVETAEKALPGVIQAILLDLRQVADAEQEDGDQGEASKESRSKSCFCRQGDPRLPAAHRTSQDQEPAHDDGPLEQLPPTGQGSSRVAGGGIETRGDRQQQVRITCGRPGQEEMIAILEDALAVAISIAESVQHARIKRPPANGPVVGKPDPADGEMRS